MGNEKPLRLVMQALGVYCIIQSLLGAFQAFARWLTWRIAAQGSSRDSIYYFLMDGLVVSGLMLVPAWVLLARTDWCVNLVEEMSKPRSEDNSQDGLDAEA